MRMGKKRRRTEKVLYIRGLRRTEEEEERRRRTEEEEVE